jgi:hypothetical protein
LRIESGGWKGAGQAQDKPTKIDSTKISTVIVDMWNFQANMTVAENSIMWVGHEPWPFDEKIPSDARIINLSTTDPSIRSPYDLDNWVDTGFVVKDKRNRGSLLLAKGTAV